MENIQSQLFPPEIYENILKYADGLTLLQAELVCTQWKNIVQYLEEKYNIWERCCRKDLPTKDLHAMLEKFGCSDTKEKWKILYRNWASWQNLESKRFDVMKFEQSHVVTCARISGRNIIVGCLSGHIHIKIMNTVNGTDILHYGTIYHKCVEDLHCFNEKSNDPLGFKHTHLMVSYEGRLVFFKLTQSLAEVANIQNVLLYSIYQKYVCYADYSGNVNVKQIIIHDNGTIFFKMITSCCLYTPLISRSLCIYENMVTLITDSNVLSFNYNLGIPITSAEIGQLLPYSQHFSLIERFWIFYNEIIFGTTSCYLYLTTISANKKNIVEKKINCMEILGSSICDICLHGSILILSMLNGMIFAYCIKDWSTFDLAQYSYKVHAHTDAICGIDFQELSQQQRLILSTNYCILMVVISNLN